MNTPDSQIIQTESTQKDEEQFAPSAQIAKLHRHLGHADVPTLWRISKQAGFKNGRQSIERSASSRPCEKQGNPPRILFCLDTKRNTRGNVYLEIFSIH